MRIAAAATAATALPAGEPLRFAAALLTLAGGYGVTAAANIPLNNALDRADPDATSWTRFRRPWTRWNPRPQPHHDGRDGAAGTEPERIS